MVNGKDKTKLRHCSCRAGYSLFPTLFIHYTIPILPPEHQWTHVTPIQIKWLSIFKKYQNISACWHSRHLSYHSSSSVSSICLSVVPSTKKSRVRVTENAYDSSLIANRTSLACSWQGHHYRTFKEKFHFYHFLLTYIITHKEPITSSSQA